MSQTVLYEFQKINTNTDTVLAIVTLNRPEKANALNEEMIESFQVVLDKIQQEKNCRLMLLKGNGSHFCSGADLGWMKKSASLSYEENIRDAEGLSKVFEKLADLPFPTLALAKGSTAGGGLGLLAACDLVVAEEKANFSLKEVRVGLLPAIILPYLVSKMQHACLHRFGLTAEVFSAQEALQYGLITHVCKDRDIDPTLQNIMNLLLQGAPNAQAKYKNLLKTLIHSKGSKMHFTCVEAIAKARCGEEGQKGLASILSKTQAEWVESLPKDWKLP